MDFKRIKTLIEEYQKNKKSVLEKVEDIEKGIKELRYKEEMRDFLNKKLLNFTFEITEEKSNYFDEIEYDVTKNMFYKLDGELKFFIKVRNKEKPKFNEPWKPEIGEQYVSINSDFTIGIKTFDINNETHLREIASGNCFKFPYKIKQAEQRAKEIKVYNLLKSFSDANSSIEFDGKLKLFEIAWNDYNKKFEVRRIAGTVWTFNRILFSSKEVAEEALSRYRKELEELVK
jgi:hypothetical protein